jgi:hypothetical protein
VNQVLLLLTREAIPTMGWTVLPRPPYSPDIAASDFHVSGFLKDALRGRRFAETARVKRSDTSAKSFTRQTYSVSCEGRKSVLIMEKTLWKHNLNFIKDVPMIYVSFIVIIVSEKKK